MGRSSNLKGPFFGFSLPLASTAKAASSDGGSFKVTMTGESAQVAPALLGETIAFVLSRDGDGALGASGEEGVSAVILWSVKMAGAA